jgi:hypothetical protein
MELDQITADSPQLAAFVAEQVTKQPKNSDVKSPNYKNRSRPYPPHLQETSPRVPKHPTPAQRRRRMHPRSPRTETATAKKPPVPQKILQTPATRKEKGNNKRKNVRFKDNGMRQRNA